jgi:hypothetical protein
LTTAERLLAYVVGLACEIGDRNVSRPGALEAAAEYIRGHRSSFGYRVNRQEYQVKDVTCANLGRAPRRLARLECGQATEPQPPEMAGDGAPRQAKPRMRTEGIAADSGPWIASPRGTTTVFRPALGRSFRLTDNCRRNQSSEAR